MSISRRVGPGKGRGPARDVESNRVGGFSLDGKVIGSSRALVVHHAVVVRRVFLEGDTGISGNSFRPDDGKLASSQSVDIGLGGDVIPVLYRNTTHIQSLSLPIALADRVRHGDGASLGTTGVADRQAELIGDVVSGFIGSAADGFPDREGGRPQGRRGGRNRHSLREKQSPITVAGAVVPVSVRGYIRDPRAAHGVPKALAPAAFGRSGADLGRAAPSAGAVVGRVPVGGGGSRGIPRTDVIHLEAAASAGDLGVLAVGAGDVQVPGGVKVIAGGVLGINAEINLGAG